MPLHEICDAVAVADVALDDVDAAVLDRPGEVLAAPANEVVEHDDFACARAHDLVDEIGPDSACATGDEYALTAQGMRHVDLTRCTPADFRRRRLCLLVARYRRAPSARPPSVAVVAGRRRRS